MAIEKRKLKQLEEELYVLIREREDLLSEIVRKKKSSLKGAPKGMIRSSKCKNTYQYYLRNDSKDIKGTYIKRSKMDIAIRIAQRDYDEAICKNAEKEYRLLKAYKDYCSNNRLEGIYDALSEGRRRIVKPVVIPDAEYIKQWKNVKYEPMPIGDKVGEFISPGGIRVRSKIELIIASMLEQHEIPYRYEYPLILQNRRQVRPDFLCLNKRTRKEYVWEHFGMMDDEEYANKNVAKIEAYEGSGYFAGESSIMTFETSQHPLSTLVIKNKIERYLI